MIDLILQVVDMKKIALFFSFIFIYAGLCLSQEGFYVSQKGEAGFKSEAPLEIIKAKSKSLRGVIDPFTKEFAFSLKISSFQGFNSEIQRVHFLENYMEWKTFPMATFTGKLIEDIPFDTLGTYSVRAKGELEIHGVRKERILRGTITLMPGTAQLTTNFSVPVADHGISIPKIVKQKIAEQIAVSINIEFVQGSKS